ncbi:MAG: hypothetical protein RR945_00300 [Erysipelotrichaceae bacterium]
MSVVRAFYNHQSFPDILMVVIKDESVKDYETRGNITALYDEFHQCLGYNIKCTNHIFKKNGYQAMDNSLLAYINEQITTMKFEALVHDFTSKIVIGHILKCEEHPDSDHLHVCLVDIGSKQLQIVCGAHNVENDQYVVAAIDQAVLPDGKLILNGKLRGVKSEGMLCSAWELGLIDHKEKGILVLDKTNRVGNDFFAKG